VLTVRVTICLQYVYYYNIVLWKIVVCLFVFLVQFQTKFILTSFSQTTKLFGGKGIFLKIGFFLSYCRTNNLFYKGIQFIAKLAFKSFFKDRSLASWKTKRSLPWSSRMLCTVQLGLIILQTIYCAIQRILHKNRIQFAFFILPGTLHN